MSAATLAAAFGLVMIYAGLRRDFAPAVALLTTVLLGVGTSLFVTLFRPAVTVDVIVFALVATAMFGALRYGSRHVMLAACVIALLLPIAARYFGSSGLPPDTLFSPDRGVLALYPVSYVALLGTLAYFRQNALWTGTALLALVIWRGIGADLTAALALLAPGLALVIEWARRHPVAAVAPLVVFMIAWNYWLMVQYTAGMVPKDAPVSFTAMVRQQADVHTRSPYVYPFAFPANVVFAWREGVPVDRYDVLAQEPRGAVFELVLERGAERFLLDGWGPPGTNETGPFRWIDEPRASLVFPLQPSTVDLTLEIVATARGEDRTGGSVMQFDINGHPLGHAEVSPAAATRARFTIPATSVGRVIRAGYNRLRIVTSGQHRIAIHALRIAPSS